MATPSAPTILVCLSVVSSFPLFPRHCLFASNAFLNIAGTFENTYVDAAQLRKWVTPLHNFSVYYNVSVLIGEFSAVRWCVRSSSFSLAL